MVRVGVGQQSGQRLGTLEIVLLRHEFEKQREGQGPRFALGAVGIDRAQRLSEHGAHRLKDLPPGRDLERIDLHQLGGDPIGELRPPAPAGSGQRQTPSARIAAVAEPLSSRGQARDERFDEWFQGFVPQQPVANDEQLLGSRLRLRQAVDEALRL